MERMEEWEAVDFYNVMHFSDRNQWEIGRLVAYFCCLPYMKEKTKITDFIELPFDEVEHNYEISNNEIEILRQMSKSIESKMKEGG